MFLQAAPERAVQGPNEPLRILKPTDYMQARNKRRRVFLQAAPEGAAQGPNAQGEAERGCDLNSNSASTAGVDDSRLIREWYLIIKKGLARWGVSVGGT